MSRQCLSSVEYYDPETDMWHMVEKMTCKRSGAGVGVMDGLLYAVGGHDGPVVRNTVEVYDPTAGTWKQIANMSFCRRNAGKLYQFNPSDFSGEIFILCLPQDSRARSWEGAKADKAFLPSRSALPS